MLNGLGRKGESILDSLFRLRIIFRACKSFTHSIVNLLNTMTIRGEHVKPREYCSLPRYFEDLCPYIQNQSNSALPNLPRLPALCIEKSGV